MDRADWELLVVSLVRAVALVVLIALLVYSFLPKVGFNG